jgi:hypothetical protein
VFFALTTGAKIYYLAAAYAYLLAAGAVAIDGWLHARPGRVRNLVVATALTTVAVLPIVLPVLPAADIGWTYKTNPDLGQSIGWRRGRPGKPARPAGPVQPPNPARRARPSRRGITGCLTGPALVP